MYGELVLWRRHLKTCKHRAKGVNHTKCDCPVWCDGILDGKRRRHTLKTANWDRAIREVERMYGPHSQPDVVSLDAAIERYLSDCRARNLAHATIVSYTNILASFAAFCRLHEYASLSEITLDVLGKYRAARRGRDGKSPATATTQRKEIECLRVFCGFAVDREWMRENFAKKLKPPRQTGVSTLPFSASEVERILKACDAIENHNEASAEFGRKRARATVLLFLYSGLRISDVAKLACSALERSSGRLMLRMMKTGSPLYVKIPEDVMSALDELDVIGEGKFFFWNGKSKITTVTGSIRRTLVAVANGTKTDELPRINVHPHRFRDTFAIRLLEENVPIRTVQLLLGHTSVLTTERHYAPFVSSQQRLLDDAVSKLDFSSGKPRPHRKPPQHEIDDRLRDKKSGARAGARRKP